MGTETEEEEHEPQRHRIEQEITKMWQQGATLFGQKEMSLHCQQQILQGQLQQIEQQQGVLHLTDTQFTKLTAEMEELKEGLPTLVTRIAQQVAPQIFVEVEQGQHQQEQRFNNK